MCLAAAPEKWRKKILESMDEAEINGLCMRNWNSHRVTE